ncbi:MAG: CBS domain-containing protein [Saprospiraceae bacterium]|nr:CBS domain-containing protein [Saprospiraceae bacterium]
MRERGFLETTDLNVGDLISQKSDSTFITVNPDMSVREALEIMKSSDISQMPVLEKDDIIGSITESNLLSFILEDPFRNGDKKVTEIMGLPFPLVSNETLVKELNRYITKSVPAVIAKDTAGTLQVITQYDIIQAV